MGHLLFVPHRVTVDAVNILRSIRNSSTYPRPSQSILNKLGTILIMSTNKDIVVAFDLYGTLLSTESIAKELSKHFGDEKAQTIATVARRYQLEYTWRLNSMSTTPPPLP